MSPKKNILLFRGANTMDLKKTVQSWKQRFVEKYSDMNLLDIDSENMPEWIITDCMAEGFMGSARMVIFRDMLLKTDKQIKKMQEEEAREYEEELKKSENAGKTIDFDELLQWHNEKKESSSDEQWIGMLEKIPEKNFILFVWNTKPITDLEKWLIENATIHDFPYPNQEELEAYIQKNLSVTARQTIGIADRLNYNYDFVVQEVKKLALAQKETWSDEELMRILPDYREEKSYEIMNPLWSRQWREVNSVFRHLMETADHELSMASIITMIRKTLIISVFPDASNKLPTISETQKRAGKKLVSIKYDVKKLYDDIVAVDIAEKSGELPGKKEAFLMALLNFCHS